MTNVIKKKIAIVGAGVSGLTCAHYLVADNDVTLFEANDYIGGHVNTLDVTITGKKNHAEQASIDTGFIVFNERTYPNFFRLLDTLDVPFQKTDMSFSVKNPLRNFEYNGHTVNSLLAQRRNVMRPRFWQFAKDILVFNKHIKELYTQHNGLQKDINDLEHMLTDLHNSKKLFKNRQIKKLNQRLANKKQILQTISQQTLASYLASQSYGKLFTDNYLIPMVSAIWSMGLEESKDFPLIFFAKFFENHGLLDVINRPQWFTVNGGSKAYVNALVARYAEQGGQALVSAPVQSVTRLPASVIIEYQHQGSAHTQAFDEVIFACHADTALKLLRDCSHHEVAVLKAFSFTDNVARLHTDTSMLPQRKRAWASWNYLLPKNINDTITQVKPVLTYHMNILQRLVKKHNYLVTLNQNVASQYVIKNIDYRHPVYNLQMLKAQQQWQSISAHNRTHFCGAYWFSGFHEDGVRSGLRVCQSFVSDLQILDDVDPLHLQSQQVNPHFSYKGIPYKKKAQVFNKSAHCEVTATTNTMLNTLFTQV